MKTMRIACAAMVAAAALSMTTGCKKDQFDPEIYHQVVTGTFPIDTIDPQHDWQLLRKATIAVTPDVSGVERVQILSGNPYATSGVEIIEERFATEGQRMYIMFKAPSTMTRLWAAAVTADGRYTVVPFNITDSEVTFGSSAVSSGTLHQPTHIGYTYLFEANFPAPGDFDFNDLVLRIRKWASSPREIKLEVTLAAAGTQKQVAAALHIQALDYSMVESVTIDEGDRFDNGYPLQRMLIESDKTMLKARNGDLVINLFEDAHWALKNQLLTEGTVYHVPYNTTHVPVELQSDTVPTKTRTFTILLAEGYNADNYALADLDPFVVEQYNSKQFEVHTYYYKFTETLWQYYGGHQADYDDLMAWALLVPSSTFRYPLEEIPLCTYRNNELFGAYNRLGHSFGEWGHDHTTATDWWQHPVGQVY